MSRKDEYVEKLKAQLDEWSAEIDVLEARLRQANADLHITYETEVEALKLKRDEAKVRLALVQESAGEAWQELRKGSDEAWESIKKAVAEARKKFN
jgi:chromosome segregation ATPase